MTFGGITVNKLEAIREWIFQVLLLNAPEISEINEVADLR